MTLLMVNDAVIAVEAMKEEINWNEYGIDEVFTAYNVRGGQDIIQEQNIDILLCDIEMPGENGIELIEWIREKKYDIDCVLLTCHAEFGYAQKAVSLNCHDYILLPSSYEEIGATVSRIVERRQQRLTNEKLQEYGKSWLSEKKEKVLQETGIMKSPKEVVEECVMYIISHLSSEDLSVNELAAYFYLNPIYLNRIFKKEKNLSISQFIIKEKMALAAQLLSESRLSVVAIAEQVGYPNYSYFTTIFKKYYGCTPTQYRLR
ncbi:MAG: AraC family transcriptional regulator [Lachnospiraceae bacterium]|nr:AraC family transcriptional regulator [Lachnospiraceae bacterium]